MGFLSGNRASFSRLREFGHGGCAHRHNAIAFAAQDNSDPRTSRQRRTLEH
ncbi:hypothetical protein [Azospirillum formosense]|uniref:hypothetical protein n=1 Tax=Azospirillum formosense TaxID=861533 RepID=UPI00338D7950